MCFSHTQVNKSFFTTAESTDHIYRSETVKASFESEGRKIKGLESRKELDVLPV